MNNRARIRWSPGSLLAAAGPLLVWGCTSVTGEPITVDAGPHDDCDCAHGTCDDEGVCQCAEGWAGARCDTCDVGYEGPTCAKVECEDPCTCGDADAACAPGAVDDGVLDVELGQLDLSVVNHAGRTCADGGDAVAYRVIAAAANGVTLDKSPSGACLSAGDEVLLINLQGRPGAQTNVGNFELLHVASVNGAEVEFTSSKQKSYGQTKGSDDGLGASGTQRVVLQRVPNYAGVTVTNGATVTASAWDGTTGGVLAFRSTGKVNIAGTLSMVARGYRPQATANQPNTDGLQGEGTAGSGIASASANSGGGGGGPGDSGGTDCGNKYGVGGGGGGHGTAGTKGSNRCAGEGGAPYGSSAGDKLFLGGAGGSGGADDFVTDNPPPGLGGAGGGIVLVMAEDLTVGGAINANGQVGTGDITDCQDIPICMESHQCMSTSVCYDFSGPGGGGAGGSIFLQAAKLEIGNALVTARGGPGGRGDSVGNPESVDIDGNGGAGDGGAGGAGRVFTKSSVVNGQSDPATTVLR